MLKLKNLQTGVELAPYTTYKIGGPADYFFVAITKDDLASAIRSAKEANIPYFLLGQGANILVSDAGFRGLVILNQADKFEIKDQRLIAESGAIIPDLIKATTDQSLSGLEHYVGIPSSVGGALWQNLHFLSPDRDRTVFIAEILESAEVMDQNNQIKTVEPDFFQFGYDDSILHHQKITVLQAAFKLKPLDQAELQRRMDENMKWRRAKQPQLDEYASCGSVFKKIEGVGAGRLIEQAGLKGRQVGQIQVSGKHANYLINLGGGTAQNVLELIKIIQTEVKAKTGYDLEPEIGLVGF